ncbi:hypothetical protein SO802_016247 [Lithocarpus litseifolius]|uniref:Uncharacterized protein n=1 Tax=Lithocarpus litseifolius TaxID=425828 RepID=A0AAW2D1C2_9ROSI
MRCALIKFLGLLVSHILRRDVNPTTEGFTRERAGIFPLLALSLVPKCVIKAKDPRLHQISVAVPGFLFPEGTPIPEGAFITQPISQSDIVAQTIPEGIPKATFPLQQTSGEATSSRPINKEGDEEKEKGKEIVDVSDSDDSFEAFNQPSLPELSTGNLGQISPPQSNHFEEAISFSDEMGIQHKPRSSLLDLIES